MVKQRNSPQKKKHEETRARDLTNTDRSKMSEPEFRITIKILAGVQNKLESISSGIKEVKNSQIKDNAVTELQSWMEAVAVRIDEAEQKTSYTEEKLIENNEAEK